MFLVDASISSLNSRIQSGRINAVLIERNNFVDIPIIFEHKFSQIPTVTVCVRSDSEGASDYSKIDVIVLDGSETTNGFTARFIAGEMENNSRVPGANWIAVS